jgi:putative pyruvate formate lyase activating enzyme
MVPSPSYLRLLESGELRRRADAARERSRRCDLCPRACGADRLSDVTGSCGEARLARISSLGPHFGEERPLVGWNGSGTIFFSGCNLRCAFCQNADLSQGGAGRPASAGELAGAMLAVQELGCHNLNLVTPSHLVAPILEALCLAAADGLRLPVVWNCGGYEALSTLALLDGVVDIYMPDLKYMDAAMGQRYSGVPDYPEVAGAALREMQRQVGELELDERGVAWRGLLLRHLVLPGGAAGTAEAVAFIAAELSPRTYVNLMDQYRPCHRIHGDPLLGRRLSPAEFDEALRLARAAGLSRLD